MSARGLGAALLLAASGLGCAAAVNYLDPAGPLHVHPREAPPAAGLEPGPLRVVSFNVAYAIEIERAIGVLRETAPLRGADVVALQEMDAPGTERIARALGMKYLNIQSMRRGDELVPFEFNGRLSGTTAMVSRVFNAPEMFIRERILGERIARVDNPVRFVAMRYYEEVYATPEQIDALLARSAEI